MKPEEVEWRDNGLDGKLDLVVTLDFRLSSTCLYPTSCCRPPRYEKTT